MQPDTAIPGKCGAKNRNGTRCSRVAGWGTDHVGAGRCKNHSGSTPTGRKVAAREQAATVVATTGWHIAVDTDPLDGLLQVIRGTAGQVAHANALVEREAEDREKRGGAAEEGPSFALIMLRDAQNDLARYCKMALDAGVAERKVRIAERTGALIAAAIEDAMGEMPEFFPPEVRARFARAVEGRLAVLERLEPDQLEAGA